ncbi:DUF6643 family protein [Streptomyces marincola]|uniref:DUF6643 family protein n=1 Tax=Streptomyces marincola TaxID=2878388 RepID=UPI001CF39DB7|nr:DUF6643 family protein [Streptomyces marincola]UCM86746.1 hypothetical protein LC193_01655 [Streptomyces marincola]
MTSPRPYGGAYSAPSFVDTPIYDRLVAERGTPQIAPIRVPAAYDSLGYQPAHAQSSLPALPALPAAPAPAQQHAQPHPQGPGGYPGYQATPARGLPGPVAPQPAAPYFPQQGAPRPYQGGHAPQAPAPQQMRPAAPRPAVPRPMQPGGYPGQQQAPGHQQPAQHQYPGTGYWSEQGAGH